MSWFPSRGYLQRLSEEHWKGATPPDPTKHQVILTNASTYIESSSVLDVILQECPTINGYSRQNYNPSSGGFDANQNRFEMPSSNVIFYSSIDGSIQFDRAVILTNADPIASVSASAIDDIGNTFSLPATADSLGLTAGKRVTVTADSLGTVPPELLNNSAPRELFISNPSGSSVQFSATAGGTPIDFSSGVLPVRIRVIGNAQWELYEPYGSSTIPQSGSVTINITINFGSGTADVNSL